jgi:hypothetical protein
MSQKTFHSLFVSSLLVLAACTPKPSKFGGGAIESQTSAAEKVIVGPVVETKIDNRGAEQVLCEEGPKVLANAKKGDFSADFKLICEGSETTQAFKRAITNAYTGTGTPQVEVLKLETNDQFVSEMSLIFAIKAPLLNPALFADLKPHDILASGIKETGSELFVKVESRKPFPGRGSVEQVVLNYDLTVANGASVYDTRRTEFNTYLLVENNRDIVVSSEYLLDAETNDYYHKAQGLTVGVKAEGGQSYLVFVNNLVIKNRIDPERLKTTLTNLNAGVGKMLQEYLVSKSAK